MANTDILHLSTIGVDIGKDVFHLIGLENTSHHAGSWTI